MKENMEYIDHYFVGKMSVEEKKEFEKRLADDSEFADDVAFYLSAMQVAREESVSEKKSRFKELYRQNNETMARPVSMLRKLWPYMSAAAILLVVFLAWTFFLKSPSPQQLAGQYIEKELKELGVQMSTTADSLELGKRRYNEGKLEESLQIFEGVAISDPSSPDAKKFAGIVYLRLNQYDKALHYFKQLENQKGLFANPGAFYQALTLMRRNLPNDELEAKKLLGQVVEQDLEGKETAEEWLKKW
jgi:tetratricopeptide (TPR) repeat protein